MASILTMTVSRLTLDSRYKRKINRKGDEMELWDRP